MKKYRYKVTVGMPVYQVEAYVKKSLLSILNQTFEDDIEIIVIDDRGQDRSIDIINKIKMRHPKGKNIRIITQPQNLGCWAARNKILDEAQGEYIMLIDSDDYISKDCIEKLYVQAIKYQAETVFGAVLAVNPEGQPLNFGHDYLKQPDLVLIGDDKLANYAYNSEHTTLRDFIWNILFSHNFIEQYHIRFKRALFNDDLICSCDMIPLVKKAVIISCPTYYYVIRENSLSNYQQRNVIRLDEIKEFIRIYSYLKNKCLEQKEKSYFESHCTKRIIQMFYMICGILKNESRIVPSLEYQMLNKAMRHPLPLHEILRFKKHKIINIGFYVIGILPTSLSILIIKFIGKKKHVL